MKLIAYAFVTGMILNTLGVLPLDSAQAAGGSVLLGLCAIALVLVVTEKGLTWTRLAVIAAVAILTGVTTAQASTLEVPGLRVELPEGAERVDVPSTEILYEDSTEVGEQLWTKIFGGVLATVFVLAIVAPRLSRRQECRDTGPEMDQFQGLR